MDQTVRDDHLITYSWFGLTLIAESRLLGKKSVGGGSVVKGDLGVVDMHDLMFVPGLRCLFTADGRRVDETMSIGSYPGMRPVTVAKLDKLDPPTISVRADVVFKEPVTFGGATMNQYGHQITDGMARQWWFDDRPSLITEPLSGYQIDLADMGSPRNFITPTRPTLFRRVTVPLPSILSDGVIHDVHDTEHRIIAETALTRSSFEPGEAVYLSRSRLAAGRSVDGEAAIEALLSRAGYRVVHPQELPIEDQIAIFNRARIVVGCSGSALHTSLFHLDSPLKIVTLCASRFNRRFGLVDRIKDYQATYVECLDVVGRDRRGAIASVRVDMRRALKGLKMAGAL